jgi:hypothetical protein
MKFSRVLFIFMIVLLVVVGCAKRSLVPYEEVDKTNYVIVKLTTGESIRGTTFLNEPHQIGVLLKNGDERIIPKSSIRTIHRKPPIYDDFGRGISEEEIKAVKTKKHSTIYGLGGGALSLGVSFFIGSAIQGSGTTLAATSALGGGLGTLLFIQAGRSKDRADAIKSILERRRSVELKKEEKGTQTKNELQKQLEVEKKKQEELRKQREKLLQDLGKEKEKKKEIE